MRAIDFMPPRGETPDIVRIVEGLDGEVPMRSELVIRFDYGSIVPWVRRVDHARVAVAGPDALCFRTPVEVRGENMTTVSEFVAPPRRARAVRADVVSVAPAAARRDRPRGRRSTTPRSTGATGRARASHGGDYHDEIHQSLLVLKALTYGPDRRRSSPRRRRRCPSGSAASATGTTASAGCATRPSRSLRDAQRRLPRRGDRRGATGCCARSPATRPTCRSCTASPASGGSTSASSTGCRATRARGRCGSATPPRSSSSSTSTAR